MSTLQLASSITTPLAISHYVLRPGVVYTTSSTTTLASSSSLANTIQMSNTFIVSAIARGILVFTDGTNPVTFLTDPAARACAMAGFRQAGLNLNGSNWNIYGVA